MKGSYRIMCRESTPKESASEEGPSDDGCRPAWTEVPPWHASLVPCQD